MDEPGQFQRRLLGSRGRLAPSRHAVARRSEVRAQDEFAIKTARLKTAVRAGHLIKGDPLGNARLDVTRCQ